MTNYVEKMQAYRAEMGQHKSAEAWAVDVLATLAIAVSSPRIGDQSKDLMLKMLAVAPSDLAGKAGAAVNEVINVPN